ncbi:coiled-coil domain-containing protein 77-like protein [Chrysochromulina tobinii]|uniref:Coiled-coil domain-containing protein 77-like protein n=1 Tax=Chrysochromulina tobinii TaxID=1460289 RepID=A0A0M0K5L0_9EUKA|nr:coiled-coil domain-containing protein 77-like protein [Chrysochromulina tobinii]|eukprot:KOO33887.1 coiled-coil domain-containing protein 77-like protein [Chrysochromulina sp. CCMP291]
MRGLESRIDACAASQAAQHKARWETLKRMDEITDLQKALSDSHIYLWEERENCQRLQAENDELRIQELEDRRKIQHLLSLVDPLVQDTTYVDALLLTVESLRTQLQQQEQLGRERVAALLEDRRLRLAEERARRAAESDRAQEADATLEKTQQMLHQYTKDYLSLKHEGLTERRQLVERLEDCTRERDRLAEELHAYKAKAEIEMHAVNSSARSGAEQYIALYRQQVSDTERTMGLLKDQHNGLQQALAMRIKELEATVLRLKQSYRELDQRRALEVEGFTQEIGLMRKQVRRLELRLFGRKPGLSEAEAEANVPTPRGASAKVAHGAKALRAMQARVAALEKSLLTLDEDDM